MSGSSPIALSSKSTREGVSLESVDERPVKMEWVEGGLEVGKSRSPARVSFSSSFFCPVTVSAITLRKSLI